MNVLFVLEYYPPHIGGVEVVFRNLCEGLAQRGHSLTVITCRLPGTKAFEVLNSVTIHRVRVPQKGARYWFTFLSIPQVLKCARGADLVHTTTYNGAFPAWLASKLLRKRSIITVHEVLGSLWKDLTGMSSLSAKLHQLLEKLIVSLSFDRFVSVSEYTKESLCKFHVGSEKITVVHNGIDQELFSPTGLSNNRVRQQLSLEDKFAYMYYGRPGISKGVEYLIEAVPLISQRIPDSKLMLVLANDPKDRYENIKKMIQDLNVKDKVILLDPVPRNELPGYIAASDCVVVPSLSEGFGFTAAEACAMGKPVVAANVGSLPEVVSGRYVLVEPANAKAIAEGVEMIHKGEVEDKGDKTFSWDQCVQEYLDVYQQLSNNAC